MKQYIFELISSFISFFIFFIFAYYIKYNIHYSIKKLPNNKRKNFSFIIKVFYLFIVFLGLIIFFINIGIDLKNLITGLGITSFVIGFALKDLISSIISGIIIIIDNNLSIGDIIIFKEIKGQVLDISLRYIVLKDFSCKKKHFISNNKLLSEYFSVEKNH